MYYTRRGQSSDEEIVEMQISARREAFFGVFMDFSICFVDQLTTQGEDAPAQATEVESYR